MTLKANDIATVPLPVLLKDVQRVAVKADVSAAGLPFGAASESVRVCHERFEVASKTVRSL